MAATATTSTVSGNTRKYKYTSANKAKLHEKISTRRDDGKTVLTFLDMRFPSGPVRLSPQGERILGRTLAGGPSGERLVLTVGLRTRAVD